MITEAAILIVVLLAVVTLVIPLRYMLLPYGIAICFVPTDQRIIIATLDFTVLRILILVGVLRILLRGEQRAIKWNSFDKVVLAWALCGAVVYIIQWLDTRALIYKCGVLYNIIGLYWLFRQIIRSWKDIQFIIKVLAVCVLILTPLIAWEWVTGQNPFVVIGTVVTQLRDGRFRCQASFPISIVMGVFWATLVPLFAGMAGIDKNKILYVVAALLSIVFVISTASSTPVATLFCALFVLSAFKLRYHVQLITKMFFLLLLAIHFIMKAPVWHLISRVKIFGASTGWHRYNVINEGINNFWGWWLIGTSSTSHWDAYGRLTDVTNQYLLEGIRGGIATLVLFIVMLAMAFKTLAFHFQGNRHPQHQLLAWCLCASLASHCVAFLALSYFGGQIGTLWYLLLAMIGFLVEEKEQVKITIFKSSLFRPAAL